MSLGSYSIPGVYFETPQVRDTLLRGVPVGIVGFIGYSRIRPVSVSTVGGANSRRWPIQIDSPEQIGQQLEFPEWGQLQHSLYSYFANGGGRCYVVGLPAHIPHTPESLLGGGVPGSRFGLSAFDETEQVELICSPDVFVQPHWQAQPSLDDSYLAHCSILDFCRGMVGMQRVSQGGYFAVLDAPPGLNEREAILYARRLREHPNSEFGAMYYPWVEIMHPRGFLHRMPPGAQICGILNAISQPPEGEKLGSVSSGQGPHMSCGNRALWDAVGAEVELRRSTIRDQMEAGLNCLLGWPGRGMVVWGARTLSSDISMNQMCVRRVLSYVQKSAHLGTQWAVFEPNDHNLWKQIKSRLEIFLEDLWRKGLLVGANQEDAFYVKCDEEINSETERDEGRMNIVIMVRPVRCTEFIVLHVSHTVGAGGGT